MPDATYTTPVYLTGDMVASMSAQPWQQDNPGDPTYGIVLPDVTALGSSSDFYRLVWHINTNGTAVEFENGQGWRLEVYDPASDVDGNPQAGDEGWSTVTNYENMVPKHDLASGLGAGDEYIVLDAGAGNFLLYDINGGLPASATTLTYLGSDEQGDIAYGDNDGNLDFYDMYEAVVCFAAGTRIETVRGKRPVEKLKPGDLVITRDHGPRPVAWTSTRVLTREELEQNPHLRPVRINPGALGDGHPKRKLVVSPQHRILLTSKIAMRMFGSPEVLVPAIRLTGLPGIGRLRPSREIAYTHFMFDRHEVVDANGAPCESFYPGDRALRSLHHDARHEVLELFPELAHPVPGAMIRPARPLVEGRLARDLIQRHRKNRKSLVA